MIPGIRPSWAGAGDQKRVMSPAEAVSAGADYLVIGRPITAQPDPLKAARRIVRLADPFAPFPTKLQEKADQIVIVRTWEFNSNKLITMGKSG